ncbi:MAG: GNAT family N-acetyltransferase [Hyphomicrobium sp.]|nr:GNAT family N-acetyltransferase [Hyphomicrobium sp.]
MSTRAHALERHADYATAHTVDIEQPRSSSGRRVLDVGPLSVELYDDPAAIESEWRQFEQRAVSSLFQSYDWLDAWLKSGALAHGEAPVIAVGRRASGAIDFIWPLAVVRRNGFSLLTWLGTPINSYNTGIFDLNAEVRNPTLARAALSAIAHSLPGVVAIQLVNQPMVWETVPNPLVLDRWAPNGDFARQISLGADADSLIGSQVSAQRRRDIKRKQRKIEELGKISLFDARSTEERRGFVECFLRLKLTQLEKIRSPSAFADSSVVRFLHLLAAGTPKSFQQHMEVQMVGDQTASMRWGMTFKDRYYGFNQTVGDGNFRSFSPGLVHTLHSVRAACLDGTEFYDFGPGPGDHKDFWKPTDTALVDTRIVLKATGWAAVGPSMVWSAAKVRLRAHPRALDIWRNLRFHVRGLARHQVRVADGNR